jgi:hypothetical protein
MAPVPLPGIREATSVTAPTECHDGWLNLHQIATVEVTSEESSISDRIGIFQWRM